jgi:membrane-associated phospholipid phosphatase
MQAGNILTASAVGWARIEAGDHYPSDVLAGAALGHFLTSFICKAFMGLPEGAPTFLFSPLKRGAGLNVSFTW